MNDEHRGVNCYKQAKCRCDVCCEAYANYLARKSETRMLQTETPLLDAELIAHGRRRVAALRAEALRMLQYASELQYAADNLEGSPFWISNCSDQNDPE